VTGPFCSNFGYRVPFLSVVSLLLAAGPAGAQNFQDGVWRVEVVTETRGMNLQPAPPYRYERCYGKAEITAQLTHPRAPCRAVPVERSESLMSWRLLCSPRMGDVTGRIEIRFQGDRLEGTVTTRTVYPEPMDVTQRITGRRVGDCKPRPPPPRGPRAGDRLRDYESLPDAPAGK